MTSLIRTLLVNLLAVQTHDCIIMYNYCVVNSFFVLMQEGSCLSECGNTGIELCDNPDRYDPWMRMDTLESSCDIKCNKKLVNVLFCIAKKHKNYNIVVFATIIVSCGM